MLTALFIRLTGKTSKTYKGLRRGAHWTPMVRPRRGGEREDPEEQLLDFATVSVKGQLVIPGDVRKLFDINTGDRVAFVKRGSELLIRKAQLVIPKPPA